MKEADVEPVVHKNISTTGGSFPGLKENDRWCLCALRWKEAYEAGYAPPVVLEATHEKALEFVDLEILIEHSVRPESTS